jgi:hypothetical protein
MSKRLTKEHKNISPSLNPSFVRAHAEDSRLSPIKGGKVPSPLVGEGLGEGYLK